MINRDLKIALIALPSAGLAILLLLPAVLAISYYISLGYEIYKNRGHQEFAANGVALIQPASQMDRLFDDCRHSIIYSGRNRVSTWDSVAFFGGRYELTMQVPVAIESSTKGCMIGEPRFHLSEVHSVSISPSGQVGASFSNNLEFGAAQWKTVYQANGDFGTIGFIMNSGPPVKDFEAYARASR